MREHDGDKSLDQAQIEIGEARANNRLAIVSCATSDMEILEELDGQNPYQCCTATADIGPC